MSKESVLEQEILNNGNALFEPHEIDYTKIKSRGGSFLVIPLDRGTVFSREHFKHSSVAHTFNAQFLNKLKHLDLLCHKKIEHHNNIVFSVSNLGLLVAAKKGVIFACMPIYQDFSCNIEDFVKGSVVDRYKDLDIFNKAIKKKEFEAEFGPLLANELLHRSLVKSDLT